MSHYGFTMSCLVCEVELVTVDHGLPPTDMITALARAHDAAHHNGPRNETAYKALASALDTMRDTDHDTD